MIHPRLSNYFENNNLLAVEQGGFRRGLDTTQTIFDLVDYINTGFNQKDTYCLAAFADLAKAFDSLDRSLLIKKLKCYGISGSMLKLISDYLNFVQQKTTGEFERCIV